ncbi:MAG: PDZ domain-containing protein [Bacteroidota bacterium]|nr:PDZ domain-containing protein [Bacteroidota bacterium]
MHTSVFRFILMVALIPSGLFAQNSISVFVSPNGNDKATGSKDAPFATIDRALEKVRTVRTGKADEPVSILLRQGTYYIDKPLVITPEETSTGKGSLQITAYNNEKVIISGGERLNLKWEPYRDGIMKAKLQPGKSFDQLFINGKAQILARYPDYDLNVLPWHGYAADAISPERLKKYKHPEGAFIHRMHSGLWGSYHFVIDKVDENGMPVLTGGYQMNRNNNGFHPKFNFIENVFEELNAPGEWFYDRTEGILYYKPVQGVDLSKAVVEVPVLENILNLKGTREKPVSNVNISGITFMHTLRTFMKTKEQLLRSDWAIYRQGALMIEGAEKVAVTDCEFDSPGGNAIFINNYNRNVLIARNHIHGAGATGVNLVGDPKAVRSPAFEYREFVSFAEMDTAVGPKTPDYPALCTITDNLIHDIGQIEKQSAGINLSMASEITITHNSIYDVPRAGINVCDGTWGGHDIGYNDVFNTVLETGDHGSFNSWGRDRYWLPNRGQMDKLVAAHPGLVLADAYKPTRIHDNRMRCDKGWDIDLDDGSSNYLIYNNLCLSGGLKLREGFNRKAYNNILINNSFHPHVWFKNSQGEFFNNIVCSPFKPIRIEDWGNKVDFNLFPDTSALLKARANGTDQHSAAGDPLFVNPAKGDFSVKKESPAIAVGFKNFSMNEFGVMTPKLKALAKQPGIPVLRSSNTSDNPVQTTDWRGAKLKKLSGLSEISATGMSKETGVLIVSLDAKSPLIKAGIQPMDVILKVNGNEINTVKEFLDYYGAEAWSQQVKLTIFRNQQSQEIIVAK